MRLVQKARVNDSFGSNSSQLLLRKFLEGVCNARWSRVGSGEVAVILFTSCLNA